MVRLGRLNKQKMWYATYEKGGVPVYAVDENGNILKTKIKGVDVPVLDHKTEPHYSNPIEFHAGIAMSGGNAEAQEFGLDLSSYSSVITTLKNELPINELSLIWFESEPEVDSNGYALAESADYSVVKISHSLNYDRIILKKKVTKRLGGS